MARGTSDTLSVPTHRTLTPASAAKLAISSTGLSIPVPSHLTVTSILTLSSTLWQLGSRFSRLAPRSSTHGANFRVALECAPLPSGSSSSNNVSSSVSVHWFCLLFLPPILLSTFELPICHRRIWPACPNTLTPLRVMYTSTISTPVHSYRSYMCQCFFLICLQPTFRSANTMFLMHLFTKVWNLAATFSLPLRSRDWPSTEATNTRPCSFNGSPALTTPTPWTQHVFSSLGPCAHLRQGQSTHPTFLPHACAQVADSPSAGRLWSS